MTATRRQTRFSSFQHIFKNHLKMDGKELAMADYCFQKYKRDCFICLQKGLLNPDCHNCFEHFCILECKDKYWKECDYWLVESDFYSVDMCVYVRCREEVANSYGKKELKEVRRWWRKLMKYVIA